MVEITEELLLSLAGAGPFDRGYSYYLDDRVVEIETSKSWTTAIVSGTHMYRVELRHKGRELDGGCDCPASEGIEFCKHCVATALTLRDLQEEDAVDDKDDEGDILKRYLLEQDHETLASLVVDLLPKEPRLHERLRKQGHASTQHL